MCSSDLVVAGVKSYKDQILGKIAEQERLSMQFKDEERSLGHLQLDRVQQTQMWSDVQKLLECKCALARRRATAGASTGVAADRMNRGRSSSLYSSDGRG